MDLSDPLAFSAPAEIGVRVEILPDLFVEMETARRIHALLFVLLTLIVLWVAGTRGALARALAGRPVLPVALEALEPPAPAAALARPASELRFLEGFARARKRALEVLQYAITTAPANLRTRSVELSADPDAPLDPNRVRLKLTCVPADSAVAQAFVENLRVLMPHAGILASADPDETVVEIDSSAAPAVIVDVTPAGAPLVVTAPPAASAAPLTTQRLNVAVEADETPAPVPVPTARKNAFPRTSAVPAPDHGRLVPLFAAPQAKPDAPDADEPDEDTTP